ncbi:hypothetical protein ANN_20954 [Periplaneta americana]|uniref:Uncharacterized protein n=1 Tax=Periplaneta americana TaxID=6978 RepID=A0ABQ8SET7_PERAM|nr:hypothetical protein ANN_20954 [Periplaneta americana]
MENNRTPKALLDALSVGRRKVGRPKLRWLDDVQADLTKVGIRRWRTRALDRSDWSLIWDSTCVDTLAPSHLSSASKTPESAAVSKHHKYKHLADNYIFVPFAVETFGSWCSEAKALISTIGRSLVQLSGDPRSSQYLRQRIGIAIQRGGKQCRNYLFLVDPIRNARTALEEVSTLFIFRHVESVVTTPALCLRGFRTSNVTSDVALWVHETVDSLNLQFHIASQCQVSVIIILWRGIRKAGCDSWLQEWIYSCVCAVLSQTQC